MAAVQEVVLQASAPVPMTPGLLTPLPWADWSARLRFLDVDGVHVDYIEIDPYQMDVPPLQDRLDLPVQMMLVVVLQGTSVGTIGGHGLTLGPREAAIIDGRVAMRFRAPEPVRALRLFVEQDHLPDVALASPSLPFARLKHTPLVAGCVGLLTGLLQGGNPVVEQHDERAVSAPLIALLASLLDQARLPMERESASAAGGRSDQQGRRGRIEEYIDEHLDDPALTVGAIASALGLHVRTLHAAYEGTDRTVAAEIRARRVARVQALLAVRQEPPNIAAVAARVGLTRDQLNRHFQAVTDGTAREWWRHHHALAEGWSAAIRRSGTPTGQRSGAGGPTGRGAAAP